MKKILTIYSIAISIFSVAQTGLNNLSFENWSADLPDGWDEYPFSEITQKTSGAQHGNSYAELKTTASPAMLVLGEFGDNGVPYTTPVKQISGFYRTSGIGTDHFAGIAIALRKNGNTIGAGGMFITSNQSSWTSFAIAINSVQPGIQDSISITFTSPSGNSIPQGAIFDVDNLSLSTIVGIDKRSIGTNFLVYPNPASKTFSVVTPGGQFNFRLMTMDGRIVKESFSQKDTLEIDLSELSAGVYLYHVITEDTNGLSGKLVVE